MFNASECSPRKNNSHDEACDGSPEPRLRAPCMTGCGLPYKEELFRSVVEVFADGDFHPNRGQRRCSKECDRQERVKVFADAHTRQR